MFWIPLRQMTNMKVYKCVYRNLPDINHFVVLKNSVVLKIESVFNLIVGKKYSDMTMAMGFICVAKWKKVGAVHL